MASMSSSPARTEGRDTDSISIDRSPLGAGYFSGDNDIHHSDESMEAKEQDTGNRNRQQKQYDFTDEDQQEQTRNNNQEPERERQTKTRNTQETNNKEKERRIEAYVKRIDTLTSEQLDNHLDDCGMTVETRENVKKNEFNGSTWKAMMTSRDGRIMTDEMNISMAKHITYKGYLDKYYKNTSETISEPPEPPEIGKRDALCTMKEWMNYKRGIKTWLMKSDSEMADMASRVMINKNHQDTKGFIERASNHMVKIDQTWASSIEKSDLMTILTNESNGEEKYTTVHGASGLEMFKIICQSVGARSTSRLEDVMKQRETCPVPNEPAKLFNDLAGYYAEMCEEYEIQTGSPLTEMEKRHTLYKMASGMEMNQKYTSTLGIPLANLRSDPNTNSEQVMTLLTKFTREHTLTYKQKEGKEKTDKGDEEAETQNAMTMHGYGASGASKTRSHYDLNKKICIPFRENGQCSQVATCPYNHETRGVKCCTGSDYETYGFCDQWYTCTDRHPYDALKYGPRHDALHKYLDMKRNSHTRTN